MSTPPTQPGHLHLLLALAQATGGTVQHDTLHLPASVGSGYLKAFDLGPQLQLLIQQTELREEMLLQRPAVAAGSHPVVFSFRNLVRPPSSPLGSAAATRGPRALPAVQVTTAAFDFALRLPANTPISSIVIGAEVGLLRDLLGPAELPGLLQPIVAGQHHALYEELISPAMQAVAAEVLTPDAPGHLHHYYLRLKAEELIYLFLAELLKRQHAPVYPLSAADAQQLYLVRDQLLADLSEPPSLAALARLAGMSESKLKRLFKQVFGDTIYNYYQTVRMREAAHLLKEQQLTVTEVGYQLGFKNLSHFTRLFERCIGTKPKKYRQSGG